MKWQGKLALIVFGIALGSSLAPNLAWARDFCYRIEATGIGQELGGGTTQALVVGSRLLRGTSVGNLEKTGFSGSVASVEGLVRFTTRYGMLTASVAGTFDASTGSFDWSGPIIEGTKKLAGATGSLALQGVQSLGDGSFTEKVTGEVCADLAPWLIFDYSAPNSPSLLAAAPETSIAGIAGAAKSADNGMDITARSSLSYSAVD